ncbi:g6903 [Coccomyxa elongata]
MGWGQLGGQSPPLDSLASQVFPGGPSPPKAFRWTGCGGPCPHPHEPHAPQPVQRNAEPVQRLGAVGGAKPPLDGLASQVFGVPSDGWPTNPTLPQPNSCEAFGGAEPPLDGLASQVFGVPSDGWPTNPTPHNPRPSRGGWAVGGPPCEATPNSPNPSHFVEGRMQSNSPNPSHFVEGRMQSNPRPHRPHRGSAFRRTGSAFR